MLQPSSHVVRNLAEFAVSEEIRKLRPSRENISFPLCTIRSHPLQKCHSR